jgi:hypothetical protein
MAGHGQVKQGAAGAREPGWRHYAAVERAGAGYTGTGDVIVGDDLTGKVIPRHPARRRRMAQAGSEYASIHAIGRISRSG